MTTNEMPEEIWATHPPTYYWHKVSNNPTKRPSDRDRVQYFHHTLLTAKDAEIEKLTISYIAHEALAEKDRKTIAELRVAVREMYELVREAEFMARREAGPHVSEKYGECLEKHKHLLNEQAKGE